MGVFVVFRGAIGVVFGTFGDAIDVRIGVIGVAT
jgi:hypothetical protein